MHIYPPRKNPHNPPPLLNPPPQVPMKKNNLPPNSETLFKILQPAPPIYFIEKFFGRQDSNGSEVRK